MMRAALLAIACAGCISLPSGPPSASSDGGGGDGAASDGSVTATRHWVNRTDYIGRPYAFGPRLAYDSDRGVTVMFLAETGTLMRLDPDGWHIVCDSFGPPGPRYFAGVAFSPELSSILVVGGTSSNVNDPELPKFNDVYDCSLASGTWTPHANLLPEFRAMGNLVYDPTRQVMRLIGGYGGATDTDAGALLSAVDYDATNDLWTDSALLSAPAIGITGAGLTYDDSRGAIIALQQDPTQMSMIYDAVWMLVGANRQWQTLCSPCTGQARSDASLVHIPGTAETYIINGYDSNATKEIDGTWELDDTGDHSEIDAVNIPRRDTEGAVYDSSRDVVVVHGGNGASCADNMCNDTWELVKN